MGLGGLDGKLRDLSGKGMRGVDNSADGVGGEEAIDRAWGEPPC